jgi:hypothetical protein
MNFGVFVLTDCDSAMRQTHALELAEVVAEVPATVEPEAVIVTHTVMFRTRLLEWIRFIRSFARELH